MQALGENMLAATLEFSQVLSSGQHGTAPPDPTTPRGQVYFDLLSLVMILYDHATAFTLHGIPFAAVVVLSLASSAYRSV